MSFKYFEKSIAHWTEFSLNQLSEYIPQILNTVSDPEQTILSQILKKSDALCELGLDYLQLKRESTTLSGGEVQRIRLVNQVNSGLSGLLYVLDEPSIGLHPKDHEKMMKLFRKLVNSG